MNWPTDQQRLSIIGSTGSGKTQAALWHLSHRDFHVMPWVVYDFKMETSINQIPGARHLPIDEVPRHAGVYLTHPQPGDVESGAVEAQMWAIWERGGTGVYVDEGYMVGNRNQAFRALLTQGRSKHIPMIVLSQRPVWMDKFVFSESEFFQVFRLNSMDDIKTTQKFVRANLDATLPEFHSYYYDVKSNQIIVLKPVPSIEAIQRTFAYRLLPSRQII